MPDGIEGLLRLPHLPMPGAFDNIDPLDLPPLRGHERLVAIDDLDLGHFNGIDLGVNMQGFNLNHPSQPVRHARLPTYEPPPPPRGGFTRDLMEEDVLVCPNCDDELGVGEDDMTRQVWIVKGCGHVSPTKIGQI